MTCTVAGKHFQSLVLWLKRRIKILKMCSSLSYHSVNIVVIYKKRIFACPPPFNKQEYFTIFLPNGTMVLQK